VNKTKYLTFLLISLFSFTFIACTAKPPAQYSETFESAGKWSTSVDAVAEVGVADGEMQIHVFAPGQSAWSTYEVEYKNVTVSVDTRVLDGPLDNEYGILIHQQDEQAFLAFSLSADGYVRAAKYQDAMWQVLGADWMPVDVIRQGQAENYISVTANEGHYSFSINDEIVLEIEDSSFRKGRIGLYAGSLTEGGVVVAFDNLEVNVVE